MSRRVASSQPKSISLFTLLMHCAGGGEAREKWGARRKVFIALHSSLHVLLLLLLFLFLQRKFPLPEAFEVRFKLFSAPAHPRTALLALCCAAVAAAAAIASAVASQSRRRIARLTAPQSCLGSQFHSEVKLKRVSVPFGL